MDFLMENMGTIVVLVILILVVALIIRKLYTDKKAGKHLCGGNCGNCTGCPHSCGAAKNNKKN